VYFDDDQNELWRIGIADLVVVGEYTNAGGPWSDDWFLIFGHRQQGQMQFREVPVPLEIEEVLTELGKMRSGDPIQLQLVGSTEWNSRVLFPDTLVGKPFFIGIGKSLQVNPAILQL
jgi:hypothetical protein